MYFLCGRVTEVYVSREVYLVVGLPSKEKEKTVRSLHQTTWKKKEVAACS